MKLMSRLFLAGMFSLAVAMPAIAQKQYGRIDSKMLPATGPHHLPEYNFDVAVDAAAWQSQPKGLNISFGSTEELYFRKEVPLKAAVEQNQFTAWKGERVNMQVLVWSADTLTQIRFNAG